MFQMSSSLSRRILTTAVVMLSASSSLNAQTNGQTVKVEYDSNKDITQISLNPFVLASRKLEELRLGAIAGYPGKVKSRPKEVLLMFFSLSSIEQNSYDPARKLSVFVDGNRLDWGETQRTKQAQNGLFIEIMMAKIPVDDFLQVSRAKQVKLRLGLTEVELTSSQIDLLRLMATYLTDN